LRIGGTLLNTSSRAISASLHRQLQRVIDVERQLLAAAVARVHHGRAAGSLIDADSPD
jgi:hypothetical protein